MFTSITVGDLKRLLEDQDDGLFVTFASDYGDHGHTLQVHKLEGGIELKPIQSSGYSESGYSIDEYAEDVEICEREGQQVVLVIS